MKNYIILHLVKDGEVIIARRLSLTEASQIPEYTSKMYVNETGGITIVLVVELFNNN